MIGKIVVGLLAAVCFGCSWTEAYWFNRRAENAPTCDPNVVRNCTSYMAKAPFANITGSGFVYQTSAANLSCLTLDIESLTPAAPIYNATYYDNSGTVAPSTSILVDDNGQARVLTPNSLGKLVETSKWVIVGYVSNAQGLQGYAVVSCPLADQQQNEVVIVVKSYPPQCKVVNQLKQQMKDQDSCLANIPLKTCINKP